MYRAFTEGFTARWAEGVRLGTAGDLCPADIFGPDAPSGAEALQVTPPARQAALENIGPEAHGLAISVFKSHMCWEPGMGMCDNSACQVLQHVIMRILTRTCHQVRWTVTRKAAPQRDDWAAAIGVSAASSTVNRLVAAPGAWPSRVC